MAAACVSNISVSGSADTRGENLGEEDDGEWRSETARDLADAERRLEEAAASIRGEPSREQMRSVWRAYVDVEKSIFFIRVEIDEENPGRRLWIRDYAVPDERQAVTFALRSLKRGTADFSLGYLLESLKGLRESRNYLRALLKAKAPRRRTEG